MSFAVSGRFLFLLAFYLMAVADSRRFVMPKIEISMMMEELTSEEAAEELKHHKSQSNTTTTSSEEPTTANSTETSTSSAQLDDDEVTTQSDEDSNSTAADGTSQKSTDPTKNISGASKNDTESGEASDIEDLVESEATTSMFVNPPDASFSVMVEAAKDFVKRYLTSTQWKNLRKLLRTIKEVGGSREDVHRAATRYISRVVSRTEKDEISRHRKQLFKIFNRRYLASQ